MLDIPSGSFLISIALIVSLAFVCGARGLGGVWKILKNTQFAVVVITLICFFTIIGSTLVQGRSPQTYSELYGSKFARVILFFEFNSMFDFLIR